MPCPLPRIISFTIWQFLNRVRLLPFPNMFLCPPHFYSLFVSILNSNNLSMTPTQSLVMCVFE